MNTTQENRQLKIATPLGEDYLLLQKITFTEGLSKLFEGELELWHDEGIAESPTFINPEKILGKPVTVGIEQRDGVTRYFCGIINEFEQGGSDQRFSVYHARLVPHIWMLTQNLQSRIFQNISVPDILRKLFSAFVRAAKLLRAVPGNRFRLYLAADGRGRNLLLLRAHGKDAQDDYRRHAAVASLLPVEIGD
jgi:uncharacterized protein involved in type VI secretion and phage assembly